MQSPVNIGEEAEGSRPSDLRWIFGGALLDFWPENPHVPKRPTCGAPPQLWPLQASVLRSDRCHPRGEALGLCPGPETVLAEKMAKDARGEGLLGVQEWCLTGMVETCGDFQELG